jgi:YVTN family beta-propeller protein
MTGFGCADSRHNNREELAYVTNEDSGDLSVISAATHQVIATIPVGKRPRGVKVSPDGRTIYVALSGSPKCPPWMPEEECAKLIADKTKDGIAVVDAVTQQVLRVIPGGSDPEQFDVSPDGKRLYISNEDAHLASIVEVESGKILHTIKVGMEPEGVRLSPSGKIFYVTGESDNDVTVIDAITGEVLHKIMVGERPRDAVFAPNGLWAYISTETSRTIEKVKVPENKVTDTIELGQTTKPMGLALSPEGKRLYVTTGHGGTVVAINLATFKIIGEVKVGKRPWGVALTRDGKWLYTANGPSNDVTIVDTQKLTVITTIPVGQTPWGVTIAPKPVFTKPSNDRTMTIKTR